MNPTMIIFSGIALVVIAMVSLLLLSSSPMSILFRFQNNNVYDRFTYNAGDIGLLSNNNQNIQNSNRLLLHPISFANDTLFPQTFQSSAMASNEITLSNGNT